MNTFPVSLFVASFAFVISMIIGPSYPAFLHLVTIMITSMAIFMIQALQLHFAEKEGKHND